MYRYFIHEEPCPCEKCPDITYFVFDNAFDVPLPIGQFESKERAIEYLELRVSIDKVVV